MSVLHFRYVGHITSVNRMTKVTAMRNPRTGKWQGRMYESKEYKDFKNSLWLVLRNSAQLEGYYDLKIKVSLKKVRDSDNPIKPIMDSLEKAGVIKNDNKIRNIFIQRAYHKPSEPDVMEIDLYAVKPQDDSWAVIRQGELF